ncbi:NADPH oxidase A [Phakopsora pachyrhizi]|uniref:NADPH oxidase A n=1 Tax=Phakopsora pachyrhizi TaxID=170000 RepID=A0AAV0AWC0_PHAPC|nr:NADPH oxidase A [Phakopsora pachyrhizi]
MGEESFFSREFTGRRLVFNILFYGGHLLIFAYGWYTQLSNEKLSILNLLKFSVWSSRGAGIVLGVDGFLLLLPVCRNIIKVLRPQLTWLMPMDENIWFHRQVAYSTAFFSMVHTTAHYVNMIMVEKTQVRTQTAVGIMYTQPGPFTGHVMLLIMVLMYTTAHHTIRNQCFEAFWYTHHLAFFWMLGLYTHATGCFVRGALPGEKVECLGYNTVRFTVWSGILYFGERVMREIRARQSTQIVGVLMHPSGTMEIRLKKPSFQYVAGQWLFFQMPEVSSWQWHPFTISSAPDDPYISIHVRQVGDFTRAVGERLGATPQLAATLTADVKKGKLGENARDGEFVDISMPHNRPLPLVRIDGPYGAPAEDVFKCEYALMIGAGIGVTPFSSILKNIYYMQQKGNLGVLKRAHFIWINKDAASFGWFRSLLQNLEDLQTDKEFLRMDMYLTEKMSEDAITNISVNDAGADYDVMTGLKTRTHFGRPNWPQVFTNVIKNTVIDRYGAPGTISTTKIGVFYCGPNMLAKTLKDHCKKFSSKSSEFKFYKEHCKSYFAALLNMNRLPSNITFITFSLYFLTVKPQFEICFCIYEYRVI